MAGYRTNLYCLGPHDIVSIDFEVALRDIWSPWKSVRPIPVLRRGW